MSKQVELATVDFRKFVSNLLELGEKGAKLTNECRAIKGQICRARLEVEEDVVIEESPILKVIVTDSKAPAKVNFETKVPAKAPAKTVTKTTKKVAAKTEQEEKETPSDE